MASLTSLTKWTGVCLIAAGTCLTLTILASGQAPMDAPRASPPDVFLESFESLEPGWGSEGGDVNRRIRAHDRTSESAHSGRQSERIVLSTGTGTHLFYGYPIGRALVSDDLKISVWVKADRPGVQVLARVIFPRERDPDTLQLLGTLIPGATYDQAGNWQRLELTRPDLAMERQARLLRASLTRNVDTREAYIDRIMLNVYTGPGDSTVWVDDLEVSPVFPEGIRLSSATLGQPGETAGPNIEISQDRLLVEGRPRLLRAVRAPDVSPAVLREFGFNVLQVEWPLDLERIEQAVTSFLWLMPQLPPSAIGLTPQVQPLAQLMGEFPFRESVLCWYLGTGLPTNSWKQVTATARDLRGMSPRRPVAGDVAGNFFRYSRELEMVGTHRWPIGTAMELRTYRDWITQRRYLARPGTYLFTWIQASSEPNETDHTKTDRGPEPDQIRLLTYAALSTGCRGLSFWADRSLGQPGPGRERLLELGLLNLELQLLEPYFAAAGSVNTVTAEITDNSVKRGPGGDNFEGRMDSGRKRPATGSFAPLPKPKPAISPYKEEIQATLLRSDLGLVVVPIWYGRGAQFVPGQLATNDLSIVIPGIPDATQAWQVTPVDVRMIKRERVAGGMRLTLPEFDLTSIVVLTSDPKMLDQLRQEVARTRPLATLWAAELASTQLARAKHINRQLVNLGHPLPDGAALIQSADERLIASRGAMQRGDHAGCYLEALRSLRALRLLQRAHWDEAVKGLSAPQASPYAIAFASLPDHWRLMREVQSNQYSANLIAGGDFESAEALSTDGWTQGIEGANNLELNATLSAQEPHRGERSLHLQVKPTDQGELPASLDPVMASLVCKPIPVKAGDLVRIRFWLRIPASIQGSVDGAVVYDSIGGSALAICQSDPLEWKQFTLYRPVTRPDELTVTIGLTGIGDMYVDDFVVERALGPATITHEPKSSPVRR